MGRGGLRIGAGAKSKWKNGKTITVRVPKTLVNKILEYAYQIDDSSINCCSEAKIIDLSGLANREFKGRKFVFLDELVEKGYQIKPDILLKSKNTKLIKSE